MKTTAILPAGRREVHAGFIPLTDCAPLVVAKEMGFDHANGISLTLHKEVSWANIRDKVEAGYLDCAIGLAPMPLASTLGLGGRPPVATVAVMATSLNGNAVTVSVELFEEMLLADRDNAMAGGMRGAKALAKVIQERNRVGREPLNFGMVYPFSCHNYDLRYWLASAGVDPDADVNIVVVPPPLISQSLKAGRIDGFCVGEPWSSVAVDEGHGVIVATKAELWNLSPEKVLIMRQSFAIENAGLTAALIRCLVHACDWIDCTANRPQVAQWLSQPEYVGVRSRIILRALMNDLDRGHRDLQNPAGDVLVFSRHHANFPWRSHARWLLTQMVRWGQVRAPFDIGEVADAVYRTDLYREATSNLGKHLPAADLKPEGELSFFGGDLFDPSKPASYIAQHRVRRGDIDPHQFSRRG